MTVRILQKGRQGIPSEIFDTKDGDEYSAACHFEMMKRISALRCKQSKGKKTLLCYQHPVLYMGKRSMMVRRNHTS